MFGHVTNLLTAYHHEELSPEERQRVEMHAAGCARCREQLEEIGRVVVALEQLSTEPVASLRVLPVAPRSEPGAKRRALFRQLAFAAIAVVTILGVYAWRQSRLPAWDVASATGEITKLRVGRWLDTAGFEATLQIQNVGEVRVEPNSKLRVLQSKPEEYRMELQQGAMHAKVWAPPRLFFVETPSATAIDLGCAYDLTVDKSGDGVLRVTAGFVELASKGRSSIVPAGWIAKTHKDTGPGTPYVVESSEAMRGAIDVIDFNKDAAAKAASLEFVLNKAEENDLITLWHLLPRVAAEQRRRVYEKMLSLADPPEGVTVEGIVNLDFEMMSRWKPVLGLVW